MAILTALEKIAPPLLVPDCLSSLPDCARSSPTTKFTPVVGLVTNNNYICKINLKFLAIH